MLEQLTKDLSGRLCESSSLQHFLAMLKAFVCVCQCFDFSLLRSDQKDSIHSTAVQILFTLWSTLTKKYNNRLSTVRSGGQTRGLASKGFSQRGVQRTLNRFTKKWSEKYTYLRTLARLGFKLQFPFETCSPYHSNFLFRYGRKNWVWLSSSCIKHSGSIDLSVYSFFVSSFSPYPSPWHFFVKAKSPRGKWETLFGVFPTPGCLSCCHLP